MREIDDERLVAFHVSIIGDEDLEELCLLARIEAERAERGRVVAAIRSKAGRHVAGDSADIG